MEKSENHNSQVITDKKFHSHKNELNGKVNNINTSPNFFPENRFEVLLSRTFNLQDGINSGKRTYLKQFDSQITNYVAVELLIVNPSFNQSNLFCTGVTVWYIDDEEAGRNNFNLQIKKEWEIVELVQSWGTPLPGFWKNGDCKVEIYLENKLVCTHHFMMGNMPMVDFQSMNPDHILQKEVLQNTQIDNQQQISAKLNSDNSLQSILEELNKFIGLKTLKHSLSDFITYLNFIQERKLNGIESIENLSAHCLFLGNPGTGKTTVARLLGRFFKSIGMLENGHVVEVDRSTLVGEFIGETAQKTEKVIGQAMGGILFIDEAYTLKRSDDGKDFGQEAIDIILKRMEDHQGKFFVIAAGYPVPMQKFLDSNPGLKSRFTHTFTFEDYTPEELTDIYKLFSSREKFELSNEAERFISEKLAVFCESADHTFGNARFIRNLFNETKIQLSKRYQKLPYEDRDFEASSKIMKEDVVNAFNNYKKHNQGIVFNEDKLQKYINELQNLVGLEDVKITFNKLLASLKVEQLKKERSIASSPKNLNSIFVASPGSGISSVARLFGKIFKESGILKSGQLVEIDSSVFHGLSKIDSYLTLDNIFQNSAEKIILINDSILTLQAKGDFSDSLLQYFLKKLYLCKDPIVAIVTGNETDIEELLTSVPVIQNQFPNIFNFGNYSNRQLLEIALNICQKKNYQLDEGAWQQMLEIICDLRENVQRNFYNARTIKEVLNKAISNQEERIISISNPKDDDLMILTYEDFIGIQ